MSFLRNRPWLWIVFAFALLIAGWIVLLKIAADHRPATVELHPPSSHEQP
ncbi:MAG: hypothetical protein GXX91_08715 [Verrucomicrobiaceae bacterium]|nr:hypothetical protein [Verrucomicrobiaceae bacterium]